MFDNLSSFKKYFFQPPIFTSFQDYVTGLQTLISNVVDHIKGLETHLIALKLEELILEDTSLSLVRDCRPSAIIILKVTNLKECHIASCGWALLGIFENVNK